MCEISAGELLWPRFGNIVKTGLASSAMRAYATCVGSELEELCTEEAVVLDREMISDFSEALSCEAKVCVDNNQQKQEL